MHDETTGSRRRRLCSIALTAWLAASGCAYSAAEPELGSNATDPELERLHETFAQVEVDELLASEKIRNGAVIDYDNVVGNAIVVIQGSNGYACSAQVINRWFLLTAAHCVAQALPSGSGDLFVGSVDRAGVLRLIYNGPAIGSTEPNWRRNDKDTGLLFLSSAITTCHGTFGECAANQPDVPINGVYQFFPAGAQFLSAQYLAVGLGTTDNVDGAGTLRSGVMARAASGFTDNNNGFINLMAWTQESQARPCAVDSGSPLVTIASARMLHTGIASRIANDESTCIPATGLVAYSGLSSVQLLWVAIQMASHKNANGLDFACVTAADPTTNLNVLHCDNDNSLH